MKNHHEELRWQKDDEIVEGWKNKIKTCDDFDGGLDDIAEEIWTPEKKRWKHLDLEFIHQEQTPKERITHLDEKKNKIYCMLILHQIKLMTSNGFSILLILLAKDWEVTYRKLEKVFMNHR